MTIRSLLKMILDLPSNCNSIICKFFSSIELLTSQFHLLSTLCYSIDTNESSVLRSDGLRCVDSLQIFIQQKRFPSDIMIMKKRLPPIIRNPNLNFTAKFQ